jgi:ABC-type transport system substrate-binding protein
LGAVLLGCPPRPSSPPAAQSTAPGGAGATAAAPALPPPGDTFVFARGGDSVGLDPAYVDDGESLKVAESIFDGLLEFKPGTTEVAPSLAESWDVSADGLVYTFHLRQGVVFHDGTPFDADVVLFSLGRQADPQHPAHGLGGSLKYWPAMGMSDIVQKMEKTDASTVVVTLKHPEAPFLANLAMHFASMVSPKAVMEKGERFPREPVGTGPFRFVRWDPEQKIVLERFDAYWGGKPALRQVIFEVIKDRNIRTLRFQSGEISGLDDPGPSELQAYQSTPHARILQQPGMNVGYLAMNTTHPPFDDPRVRTAVNMAIDKARIVADVYKDTGTVAKNPLPPTLWGYADEVQDFAHDPDAAKKLLAEAGRGDGFACTLYYMPVSRPYMPDGKKVAEAIQLDLRSVGIDARLTTYDWATYLDKVNTGEHDMALLGWSGDNGDPDNFLYNLLSINAADQKPSQNIAFWRNAEFDRLITEAKRTTDQAARSVLYRQAQEVFHRDPPWVCLAHNLQTVVVRSDVEGLVLYPDTRKDFRPVRFVAR